MHKSHLSLVCNVEMFRHVEPRSVACETQPKAASWQGWIHGVDGAYLKGA